MKSDKIKYRPHYNCVWRDPAESNGWLGIGTMPGKANIFYLFDRDYDVLGSVEFLNTIFLPLLSVGKQYKVIINRDGSHCITSSHWPCLSEVERLWKSCAPPPGHDSLCAVEGVRRHDDGSGERLI